MIIPKKFKIANNWISVEVVDKLDNNDYGIYNDAKNLIKIAKTVNADDEIVTLSDKQLFNTLMHELVHVMQFYYDNSTIESQAQVFANFLCEFFDTKED